MSRPKILVTAGAGRTGTPAALMLLQHGFPVRALVRRHGPRTEALTAAGAEVAVGDMFDYRDLRRALDGVQRAYHCPPFAPNLLHNAAVFALAAAEAKLEVVALLSQWHPNPSDPSFITREHWLANNLYRWMPSVDVVHVNPGLFAFVYLLGLPAIMHFGLLAAPFGEGLNAPPSNEDVGRVAAAVLMQPDAHIGRSYRPTGPELLDPVAVAAILSRVRGRKVAYRDVPFATFAKAAKAQGFPTFEISQLRHYAEALKGGTFALGAPTDHVQAVTGRAPESFETIARRYIADPTLIHPALRIGGKGHALAFLLRMLATRAPDLDAFERSRQHPLLRDPLDAHANADWRAFAEREVLHLLDGADTGRSVRPLHVAS